jgi:uncharacterized protein (TIGR02996 family)
VKADTGAALLGQVLDAPDDDAAKLIYADWLEEQGHPLADLLRAHCEKREPSKELADALAEHVAPLAALIDRESPFAGWMLDHINASAGKYAQKGMQTLLARFLSRFGVKTTRLYNHGGKVHRCSTLQWTTELLWSSCELTDFETEELAASPYLTRITTLAFDKPQFSDDGLRALAESASLKRVRHLAISAPPHGGLYGADGIVALVDALPLVTLDLAGARNKIECAALDAPPLRKLTELAITTNRSLLGLARSKHLANLTTLRITALARSNDKAVLALLDNPTFGKLERLELQIGELGEGVIERLTDRFGDRWSHESLFY